MLEKLVDIMNYLNKNAMNLNQLAVVGTLVKNFSHSDYNSGVYRII